MKNSREMVVPSFFLSVFSMTATLGRTVSPQLVKNPQLASQQALKPNSPSEVISD